jgi:carbonic anhydrase
MKDTARLIRGFRTFQKDYFNPEGSRFEALTFGQSPKIMVIGCSDSRVDPAILMNCSPGDIFTVRNVANLVPPYERQEGQHGVSAALEFAVCNLGVEIVIVLGHSHCGGIHALMDGSCGIDGGGFISRWMSIAEPVRRRVVAAMPDDDRETQQRAVEQAAITLSLDNLRTFPFIEKRLSEGTLSLHGWYFDLTIGELFEYREDAEAFRIVSDDPSVV